MVPHSSFNGMLGHSLLLLFASYYVSKTLPCCCTHSSLLLHMYLHYLTCPFPQRQIPRCLQPPLPQTASRNCSLWPHIKPPVLPDHSVGPGIAVTRRALSLLGSVATDLIVAPRHLLPIYENRIIRKMWNPQGRLKTKATPIPQWVSQTDIHFQGGHSTIPEHCGGNVTGNGNYAQWSNRGERAWVPKDNGEHSCHISPGGLWLFCQTERMQLKSTSPGSVTHLLCGCRPMTLPTVPQFLIC